MPPKKFLNAFSLIELMVVISIIGLLAGVGVPAYKKYVVKANVVAGYKELENYRKLAIQHYSTYGNFTNLRATIPQLSSATGGNLTSLNSEYFSNISIASNNLGEGGIFIIGIFKSSIGLADSTGSHERFALRALPNNTTKVWDLACGAEDTNANNILIEMAPANCTSTSLHNSLN